jgi:hypothetical protein
MLTSHVANCCSLGIFTSEFRFAVKKSLINGWSAMGYFWLWTIENTEAIDERKVFRQVLL